MDRKLKFTEKLVDKIQNQIQDMNEVSAYFLQKQRLVLDKFNVDF